jgi:hypothetical protein
MLFCSFLIIGECINYNKTAQRKEKKPQSVPSSNAIQFQKVFQHASVVRLVSHQRQGERKKNKSLETVLWMVSAAMACLPTTATLLLLEALFMQISGVSLTLTWPHRLCLLRVLLCASLYYKLSPFQAHLGRWHSTRFLRSACLFTAHVGSGSSPLSCGVFLP